MTGEYLTVKWKELTEILKLFSDLLMVLKILLELEIELCTIINNYAYILNNRKDKANTKQQLKPREK